MADYFMRLSAHSAWADARLLEAARRATGDLTQVLRELAHVRGAQEIWLSRVDARPATLPVWPTLTLDELASAGAELDRQLRHLVASLTPEAMDRHVTYATTTGRTFSTPLADVLLQLLTHGQYHRGKANALLKALGEEPVAVDYIAWQREGRPATIE
jgi:uncharacterized damage-inducible protein DinB